MKSKISGSASAALRTTSYSPAAQTGHVCLSTKRAMSGSCWGAELELAHAFDPHLVELLAVPERRHAFHDQPLRALPGRERRPARRRLDVDRRMEVRVPRP